MYKVFFAIVVLFLILFTAFCAVFTPKMHNKIFIYDNKYEIVSSPSEDVSEKAKSVQKNPEKIPEAGRQIVTKTSKTQNIKPKVKIIEQIETIVVPDTKIISDTKTTQKTLNKQTQTTTKVKTPVQAVQSEQITEQQEMILWNKWRSDLQNQIMSDAKLPTVAKGTIFRFSFEVDKYGKISNIKTWSENSMYTPYAIQYIAPVIRSYQGKDILNFPRGSNRYTTTVEGGWKISDKTKFSTPDDFEDVEKIRN